jgi:hypothetical protein
MKKPDTVTEMWERYQTLAFKNKPISDIQRNETRKAFCAGIISLLISLKDASALLSEDEAINYFDICMSEAQSYMTNQKTK